MLIKNFNEVPSSTPRTHQFLRGKIPAEMNFCQYQHVPAELWEAFPIPRCCGQRAQSRKQPSVSQPEPRTLAE